MEPMTASNSVWQLHFQITSIEWNWWNRRLPLSHSNNLYMSAWSIGKWQLLHQLPPQSSNGSVLPSRLQAICPVWRNLCSSKLSLAYVEKSSLSTVGISTELITRNTHPRSGSFSLCTMWKPQRHLYGGEWLPWRNLPWSQPWAGDHALDPAFSF